jgi:hypothetical protein
MEKFLLLVREDLERRAKLILSDGPFFEAKESISGFILIKYGASWSCPMTEPANGCLPYIEG